MLGWFLGAPFVLAALVLFVAWARKHMAARGRYRRMVAQCRDEMQGR